MLVALEAAVGASLDVLVHFVNVGSANVVKVIGSGSRLWWRSVSVLAAGEVQC